MHAERTVLEEKRALRKGGAVRDAVRRGVGSVGSTPHLALAVILFVVTPGVVRSQVGDIGEPVPIPSIDQVPAPRLRDEGPLRYVWAIPYFLKERLGLSAVNLSSDPAIVYCRVFDPVGASVDAREQLIEGGHRGPLCAAIVEGWAVVSSDAPLAIESLTQRNIIPIDCAAPDAPALICAIAAGSNGGTRTTMGGPS